LDRGLAGLFEKGFMGFMGFDGEQSLRRFESLRLCGKKLLFTSC